MWLPAVYRSSFRLITLLIASCSSAFALIKFNDGHNELFVSSSAGVSYDSNIFAIAGGEGDTSYNASLGIEYQRKVGMISVDADIGWQFSRFSKFSGENFANPNLSALLAKGTGRTTGTLKLDAKRESRAETAINIRAVSWNYDTGLQVKYPVIERYSITGGLEYSRRDFATNDTLVDMDTYALNTDLFYALNSQRDLLAGYRFRTTQTTADTTDTDHAFTVGVSGKILSKLHGLIRFGYQQREVQRRVGPDESHGSVTAVASTTWVVTSRLSLTGALSRDFVTVATDANVDTTSASLDAQWTLNAKTVAFAGVSYSHLEFLDTNSSGRKDDGVTFSLGGSYALNGHLKLSANYVYFVNGSTLPLSDYHRHSLSLTLSSHW